MFGFVLHPPAGRSRRSVTSRVALDSLIAAAVGLVVLTTGLIAISRGGFVGAMSDPVVEVLGFRHTTMLGLVETSLGAFVLLSAFTGLRSAEVLFGAALGIAGFIGAVQTPSFQESLALESSMADLAVAAGVIVVLAALVVPRPTTDATRIVQT